MSASALVHAARDVVEAAAQAVLPTATVIVGIPKLINDDVLIYLYHDGSTDRPKSGPGVVQRTHVIVLHLMIRATADDAQAEALLMDLHDALTSAFYTQHRLGGQAATSELRQRDGEQSSPTTYVVLGADGAEYRHRWFTLDAAEYLTFVMS